MLWTIAVILVIMWLLGMVTSYTLWPSLQYLLESSKDVVYW
jgi:hypothetical protein